MYTNQHELRVIGRSRSGNHAIIDWIVGRLTGRVCFLNAVQANYNPFLTVRTMVSGQDNGYMVNYPGFDLRREQAGVLSRKEWLIYSHEDEPIGRIANRNFERYHDAFVGRSCTRLDVLILRDPFNLFASRIKSGFCGSLIGSMRLWKSHAREFLRITQRLQRGPVLLSYNHWVRSREYRLGIAHALGLPTGGARPETIAACAGGSSFDGLDLAGSKLRRRVYERWRHYAADPTYRALFDDEAMELSERVFGRIPGVEGLRSGPRAVRHVQSA